MAYDVKTGKPRWSKKSICQSGAQLYFRDGKLFLLDGADFTGAVIAYDVMTGEESWRSRPDRNVNVRRTIGIDDKNVYVTLSYGEQKNDEFQTAVAAISRSTGRTVWQQKRDWGTQDYEVQGAVYGKRLVYTDGLHNLTVRDTATGQQLWSKKIGDKWSWIPTVANGLVFVPGDELTAVDLESGATRWTLSADGRRGFVNPTAIDGVLYAGDGDRGVWAVDARSGKRIWLCDENTRGSQTFLKAEQDPLRSRRLPCRRRRRPRRRHRQGPLDLDRRRRRQPRRLADRPVRQQAAGDERTGGLRDRRRSEAETGRGTRPACAAYPCRGGGADDLDGLGVTRRGIPGRGRSRPGGTGRDRYARCAAEPSPGRLPGRPAAPSTRSIGEWCSAPHRSPRLPCRAGWCAARSGRRRAGSRTPFRAGVVPEAWWPGSGQPHAA
ncbi:PQQ-binding-like beta-propeller repeat protein [Streptomyces lasalocidi]